MLALILLLQVSWLEPFGEYLDKLVMVIQPDQIRLCVASKTRGYVDGWEEVFPPEYQPSPKDKLDLLTKLSEEVDEARAACERAEILRRVTELETLVRQLIADRGR